MGQIPYYVEIAITNTMNQPKEDKIISLRIFMSQDLRNTFKSVCAKEGKNMSEVITEYVKEYVKDK